MSLQASAPGEFRDIRWTPRQRDYVIAIDRVLGSLDRLTHRALAEQLGISPEGVRQMFVRQLKLRALVVERYREEPTLRPSGHWRRRVGRRRGWR